MFDFEKLDKVDLIEGPSKASPEGQRSLLDHRWVWMAFFVLLLGAFLRNAALITLTGFMLAAVAFCWLWNRAVLGGVTYQRKFHHKRVFPGEDLEVTIIVENRKLLPVTWLQTEDEWPTGFGPADESLLSPSGSTGMGYLVNVYSLRWFERVRRRYLLTAKQRGIYPLGPTHLISGDPFSLFEQGQRYDTRDTLIVYPMVKTLPEIGIDAKDPFGDLRTPQRLFEDPSRTMGVRDYQTSDPFRSIHWKATARTGQLQVRQYEPTRSQSVVLCVNSSSFEQYWRGIWPELIEHLISVAASLASWSLDNGYAVGISTNATLARSDGSKIAQPTRGQDRLLALLETLAELSYFINEEYSRFLLHESPRLPWGATLVLMTGYLNDTILASVLRLRESGRRIVLIVVGKAPPPSMPSIITYHLPVPDAEPAPPPVASLTTPEGELVPVVETARQRYLREQT